jgi:hypothetical protein
MKNHTKKADKKQLLEKIDKLTEENQRCFLGVLEALAFAQIVQKQADTAVVRKGS